MQTWRNEKKAFDFNYSQKNIKKFSSEINFVIRVDCSSKALNIIFFRNSNGFDDQKSIINILFIQLANFQFCRKVNCISIEMDTHSKAKRSLYILSMLLRRSRGIQCISSRKTWFTPAALRLIKIRAVCYIKTRFLSHLLFSLSLSLSFSCIPNNQNGRLAWKLFTQIGKRSSLRIDKQRTSEFMHRHEGDLWHWALTIRIAAKHFWSIDNGRKIASVAIFSRLCLHLRWNCVNVSILYPKFSLWSSL